MHPSKYHATGRHQNSNHSDHQKSLWKMVSTYLKDMVRESRKLLKKKKHVQEVKQRLKKYPGGSHGVEVRKFVSTEVVTGVEENYAETRKCIYAP